MKLFFLLLKSMRQWGRDESNTLHFLNGCHLILSRLWNFVTDTNAIRNLRTTRNKGIKSRVLWEQQKKSYFAKLINDNKDTASLWRAMTEITHKSRNKAKTAEIKCSPNVFNNHFLSLTDAILKSADTSTSSDYKIPASLKKFCQG